MKKSLYAGLVLGMTSGVALAQSSVTLYGIVDEGLNFNNNAGGNRQYYLASGVLQGSRFGLRAVEDLGGGLSAIATIENGFDVNTGKLGQGGLMFGRQAYVGLSSHYGTVTMGRQYDSVVDYVGPLGAGEQWGGTYVAHPSDIDNLNNTARTNNAIKYTSVDFAGLKFGGVYALGGTAGNVTHNQIWSLGAGYVNGPLQLGVGYLNVRNPNTSFYGAGGTVAATVDGVPGSNFGSSPIISAYSSAHTQQVIAAGVAYGLGAATLGAVYTNAKFMALGDRSSGPVPAGGISGTATFNTGELSFKYQITPALLAAASYVYTHNSGAAGMESATYNQGAIGMDYFLSKRTDLYATATFQKASGTDSTGKSAVASINGVTPSSTDRQVMVRLAIRHKF
ncbi:porin [Paraburkholderia unamae]|uniref:Porin n=1 Tax=Paraburkholderia unamae TaxID=219649 RepID=A0ABX5K9Z2_9BURK|nr:porin [Paraburkholderia unamae]PVX71603.1 putative porin [Paraburkholderia unamae]CAG9274703.1 Outer membrane protein (Porin) [Paraburkholderia unamae]